MDLVPHWHPRLTMMTGIQDLPNELLLQIFPCLPLKALVAAQGTCRKWRVLVHAAHLYPARRRLLEHFIKCIDSPVFGHTRPSIVPHLQPFDRDNFISALPESTCDEFKMWIQEWPSKATLSWMWPGLPRTPSAKKGPADVYVTERGVNLLNSSSPLGVRQFTLVNPDSDLALVRWESVRHPVMCPAPNLFEDIKVNQVDVTVLPLRQFQTPFQYVTSPLYLIIDAEKGAESLKGGLWYFELGDSGCIADNWIQFLEDELHRQDAELSGDM